MSSVSKLCEQDAKSRRGISSGFVPSDNSGPDMVYGEPKQKVDTRCRKMVVKVIIGKSMLWLFVGVHDVAVAAFRVWLINIIECSQES